MKKLIIKSNNEEKKISTLEELLNYLIKQSITQTEKIIPENLDTIILWVKETQPKELILLSHLEKCKKEFTPQQTRELLIRQLSKKFNK